ncbi:hypothetical protein HAX54_019426 [Datura stramonium]|uniref:Uncharacterized protein n=1 Tax=Datura stramonium TaxID=4076 RepID=A0ABS8URG4_DATST|nr:hypothetical protein [Datura stramonium]
MASLGFTSTFNRVFVSGSFRPFKQVTNRQLATTFRDEAQNTVQKGADAMKHGADAAKRASHEVKKETASVADEVFISTSNYHLTYIKMKDTVKGKAEESTEAIKENVNKSMNTKK